jgi:hypothetical protein
VSADGPCAVWVDLVESKRELVAGLAIGPGTASGDAYRLERRGDLVVARVGDVDVAQIPYVDGVTRKLRIHFDGAGHVGLDVSADGACWIAVGAPVPRTIGQGFVRLHVEGESGKAKFDDYCR